MAFLHSRKNKKYKKEPESYRATTSLGTLGVNASSAINPQYIYLLFPVGTMVSLLLLAHLFTFRASQRNHACENKYTLLSLLTDVWRILHRNFLSGQVSLAGEAPGPGDSLRGAARELQGITDRYQSSVLLLVSMFYVFLQTFSIPGTILLNALIGTLLAPALMPALLLSVLLGTCGAFCSFSLSKGVGTTLVSCLDKQLLKGKGIYRLHREVQKHRKEGDLFGYFLFLRLTPVLPNWLINLASPIAGVPVWIFTLATAIGITPQTFLAVRFGMFFGSSGRGEHCNDNDASHKKSVITVFDTCCIALIGIAILGVQYLLKRRFSRRTVDGNHENDDDQKKE